jgi:hypothetical protein
MIMNEWSITNAEEHLPAHPVLGPATKTLANLMRATNRNSDGWAYWQLPSKAAVKLMTLIEQGMAWDREQYQHPRTAEPTAAELKRALVPIKRFKATCGFDFEIVETLPPPPPPPAPDPDPLMTITVTRSAGKDGAVLVLIDTTEETGPIRVLVNDDPAFVQAEYEHTGSEPWPEAREMRFEIMPELIAYTHKMVR